MTTTQPTTPQSTVSTTVDLSQYRWQNRLLLIFAPAAESTQVAAQRQHFKGEDAALADRDLLIFYLFDRETGAADGKTVGPAATVDLRERLNVATDFAVLLVGKDGGVKNQFAEAVAPEEIYALIDVMPMRQREMRED